MPELDTIHKIDEELEAQFDKLIAEAEEFQRKTAEERVQKMKEVEDLAQGKRANVGQKTLQTIVNDQIHQRIVKLSLKEVIVFSGQGRPATQREIQEAISR